MRFQVQGLGRLAWRFDDLAADDDALGCQRAAVGRFKAEEAEQRVVETRLAHEGAAPMGAFHQAFAHERLDRAAHRSYRHLERLAQFGLGGNGLSRLPLLGTDLGRELIAQLQVQRQARIGAVLVKHGGNGLANGKVPSLPVAGELTTTG
jgi:hypothetical protein